MALTSSELKDMLLAAGLDPTGKSVKQMKEALMLVNWAKLHPGEEFPDQFDPMLAQDVSRADRNWIKEQFPAKDWIIQRKCFISGTLVRTPRGAKQIQHLSKDDKVLTWNFTRGEVEESLIVGTGARTETLELVTVRTGSGGFTCTADHLILTSKGYKEAGKLTLDDDVLIVEQVPVRESEQILIGSVLGDGCIMSWGERASYREAHGENQGDYLKAKIESIGLDLSRLSEEKTTNFNTTAIQYESKVSCYLANLYHSLYEGEWVQTKRGGYFRNLSKKLTKEIAENLTIQALAYWYLDDGSYQPHNSVNPNAKFYLFGFGKESLKNFGEVLTRYGYQYTTFKDKTFILDWESSMRFYDDIKEYVHPQVQCKISPQFRGFYKKQESQVRSALVPTRVKSITKKLRRAAVRCLTVSANENYLLGNGTVVHNCNGMRSILNLRPDGTVYMTSRERSKKDFAFTPHHDKVLGFRDIKSPWKGKTVFDGELMMENPRVKLPSGVETTSTLQSTVAVTHMNAADAIKVQEEYGSLVYNAFDILMLNGESTEDLPYEERLKLTNAAIDEILKLNPEAPIKPTKTVNDFEDAYEVFQEFIKNGEEGIMLKRRSAKYQQGKRSKDLLKIKGMQTVDAWVSGFVPATKGKGLEDYIGGFKFTTNLDGKEHEVAAVSNIDMATRKAATIIDDNGEPTLNPEWLNKCAELVGQDFNEKSLRLNSARINEWRDDKTPEDCSLRKEEMKFNGQIDEQ